MAGPRGSLARLFCQVPAPDDPGHRYPPDDSCAGVLARLAGRHLSVVIRAPDPSVHGPCGYGCRESEPAALRDHQPAVRAVSGQGSGPDDRATVRPDRPGQQYPVSTLGSVSRSEEHTSELQSRPHLVCRLLLEKKKKKKLHIKHTNQKNLTIN